MKTVEGVVLEALTKKPTSEHEITKKTGLAHIVVWNTLIDLEHDREAVEEPRNSQMWRKA